MKRAHTLDTVDLLVRRSFSEGGKTVLFLLLTILAVIALVAGCSRTSAQQAAPPPPQVTVASVIERSVTE